MRNQRQFTKAIYRKKSCLKRKNNIQVDDISVKISTFARKIEIGMHETFRITPPIRCKILET